MPIRFFYEYDFKVEHPRKTSQWIGKSIATEKKKVGDINYVLCSDEYLLRLNQQFLKHDTYTDIISFDYTAGKVIAGEIYISLDRVRENSENYRILFSDELRRVLIHGVLHFCGYSDKKKAHKVVMRKKEEAYLSLWKKMFHVKRK